MLPDMKTSKNPREYLDEIRANLKKLQAQGKIEPAENALLGMVDGLAGLMLVTLDRVTELEKRVNELQGATTRSR